jgi:hypothetical protein
LWGQKKLKKRSKSADFSSNHHNIVYQDYADQSDYLKWKEIENFCDEDSDTAQSSAIDSEQSENGEVQIVRI